MKKLLLSVIASLMLLAMPQLAFATGRGDDNDGNALRNNQVVKRFNDMTDDNDGVMKRRNYTRTYNEVNRYKARTYNVNDGVTNNNRMTTRNWNTDWDNNMTTRTMNNTYRANAVDDNGTDWGWLGLLGLIGLAGLTGRGRDRGDVK
jgi:MYXO-CTERM domain-containing protein